jgi:4-amino-4-deoxy-L-arabinose transferase-like glycosyltransferase
MVQAPHSGERLSRLTHHLSRCRDAIWRKLKAQPLAVAILAAHLVLGILYSVVVPMWEANDETGHFAFVKYLASERRLPPPGEDLVQVADESHQPPLYYILAALATCWIDTNDGLEPEINIHAASGSSMAGYNAVVHSDKEAFPYRGTALAMHVARLVSVLISTAVVAVTYVIGRFLFRGNEAIAVGAMALNAFWPQFLFLGAVVTNDILVPLFSSLVILFLLRIAYRPGSSMDFLGLGLCLLGGVATKMSAWGLIPLAIVVLILIGIRRVPTRARWWFLPVTWFCFSGAWWWLRGMTLPDYWFETMRYGYLMQSALSFIQHPLREAVRLPWDVLPEALGYCSRTIWASFGWENIRAEEWVYQIFVLLCLIGAAGLVVFLARSSQTGGRFGVVIILFGVLALFAPPIYLTVVRGRHFLNGRIVSGAIPLLSLLLFLSLAQLIPRRHTKLLAMAVGGGLGALALIIPFRYIAPAYARPSILSRADIQDIEHPLEVNFENKMGLLGYDIHPEEGKVRKAIVVTLYWQALRIPRHFPALSTGRVEVTLYLHPTGERLPIASPQGEIEGHSVVLGPFGVVAREEPEYSIEYPLHYTLGDEVALVGYDVPDTIGGTLPVTLYWHGLAEVEEDYTVFVHVFDEEGNLLGQDDSQPRGGRYPTSVWAEGRIVEDRHYVTISGVVSPGRHRLRIVVGMYLLETMERLPVFDADAAHVRHDEIVVLHDLQVVGGNRVYIPSIRKE